MQQDTQVHESLISNAPKSSSGNKLKVIGGLFSISAVALLLYSGSSNSAEVKSVKNEETSLIDFPVLNLDDRSDLPQEGLNGENILITHLKVFCYSTEFGSCDHINANNQWGPGKCVSTYDC